MSTETKGNPCDLDMSAFLPSNWWPNSTSMPANIIGGLLLIGAANTAISSRYLQPNEVLTSYSLTTSCANSSKLPSKWKSLTLSSLKYQGDALPVSSLLNSSALIKSIARPCSLRALIKVTLSYSSTSKFL